MVIDMTPTQEEIAAYEAEVAAHGAAAAAQLAEREARAQLTADAQLLLSDMAAHATLPVASRDVAVAAQLDARAGALLSSALPSDDPAIVGLTGKITAIGLRLTRERDAYESGLL